MRRLALPSLLVAALLVVAALRAVEPVPASDAKPQPLPPPSSAHASQPAFDSFEDEVMSTAVRVTLPRSPDAAGLAEEVFALFRGVDARMSEWKDTSPLAAVNREAGRRPVPVPADLRALVRRSMEIAALTGGAFDPTWAALWGLWDFRSPHPEVPAAADVAARAALVDHHRLLIDDAAGTVFLPEEGMKIGLGGIAKGHALDLSVDLLERRGVESFMLQAGGQVVARGRRGDRPWRIGIRDPLGGRDDAWASLDLEDASTSTSGDYESFFIHDGVRYHHILDPRTGWPSTTTRSVTVLSPDATLADALSTAFMVMPPEEAKTLAERLPNVEAVWITSHGEVLTTPGMNARLHLQHPPRTALSR